MRRLTILTLGLLLAGCGAEPAPEQQNEAAANQAAAEQKAPVDLTAKERGCPFNRTSGWYAQIENRRFSVDGEVDFMMAGYKPGLSKRAGAPSGEIALDLGLEAAPGGAVESSAHYEEPMTTAYRKVTIYCGGKEVTSFEPMDQRLG